MLAGTGGFYTLLCLQERDAKGYKFPNVQIKRLRDEKRSPAEEGAASALLAAVRDLLPVSMKQLADAFGVSRQAIYLWQNGGAISADNEQHLRELADAARMLAARNLADSSALRRPIHDGKTFLQLVAAGESPVALADMLGELLERERKERGRLDELLARRGETPVDLESIGRSYPEDRG